MAIIPQIKTETLNPPSSTQGVITTGSESGLRISIPGPSSGSKPLQSRQIKTIDFSFKMLVLKVAYCFAYSLVFMIYWCSVIGTAHGLYKMLKAKDPALQAAVEQIGKNRFEAIQKAILPLNEQEILTAQGDLGKAVNEILHLVKNDPGKDYHHYSKAIQAKTEQALLLPEYEVLKQDKKNICISFLHLINDAILNKTSGGEALKEYGNNILRKYEESHPGAWNLADVLDFAVEENHQGYRYDTVLDKFTWSMAHPIRAWTKVFTDKELEYNACKTGNIYYRTHDLVLGKVRVENTLGPGITPGNRLRANLQHLQNEQSGIRFEHTLEHLNRKGEDLRKRKLQGIQEEYPKQMRLIGTCLDGDIWSGKGNFKGVATSEEFHEKLDELLIDSDGNGRFAYEQMRADKKQDCGFYFPMLTPFELAQAVTCSKLAFEALEESHYYNHLIGLGEEGHKRYVKAMDLSFNVMVFLKTLLKEAVELSLTKQEMVIRLHQACKEDVDRGAIVNVLSALYEDLLLCDQELDLESLAAESIGILLMRGLKANDRVIMKDRYEALSDLLHLIQGNPDVFTGFLRTCFTDEINYFKQNGGEIRREFS